MKRRGELKLIEQAIRQGWNITAKGHSDALALVREVLADKHATHRESLRACSVMLLMNDSNLLLDEDAALLERVKRIGLSLENARRR